MFLGRLLPLQPCGVHCSACLATLSSDLLCVCPSHFYFLLCSCCIGFSLVFFCGSLFDILSDQCTFMIFRRHLLMKTCNLSNASKILYHPVRHQSWGNTVLNYSCSSDMSCYTEMYDAILIQYVVLCDTFAL